MKIKSTVNFKNKAIFTFKLNWNEDTIQSEI